MTKRHPVAAIPQNILLRAFFRFACFAAVLLALACGQQAAAQGRGEIRGTVTDSSGAVIPDAAVSVLQVNTNRLVTVKTNKDGLYILSSLQPTAYTLTVTSAGFESYKQTGFVLQADQYVTQNIKLSVGSESNTVDVVGSAEQLNTTNATLSQVIDQDRVEDLPLNGRNAAQLTLLVAGAVLGPTDGFDQGVTKSFPEVVTPSFNGARVDQTNYLLDGGNNVDEYFGTNGPFPFPDALQEFSVQTSNYNAEYGQNAGGVVNIIIKSGAPKYHGLLFEYIRNRVFNAACYFCYVQQTPGTTPVKTVEPLKRNQFGGTFSGPLTIPHVLSGKNTVFFFGYQRTIQRNATVGNVYLPTDAERAGDFSALLTKNANNPIGKAETLKNPATGKTNTTGIFNPATDFDPSVVALVNAGFPHVTGSGQFFFSKPQFYDFYQYVGRVDHNFGTHDTVFGHYFDDQFTVRGVFNPANLLTYTDQSNIHYRSALLAETHVFSPHLINNLIGNYLVEYSVRNPPAGATSVADYGVNVWQPYQKALQRIQASGYFSFGQNPFAQFVRTNYNLVDDVHYVKGNHNIGFGARGELSKTDNGGLGQASGLFVFKNSAAGDAVLSFMLGYMSSFTQAAGGTLDTLRNTFQGYYVQDQWKASRRLSVTYGLRYEPYRPWHERDGRNQAFVPSAYATGIKSTIYPNAPAGLFFPGEQGIAPDNFFSIKTNFMPRVGFALDVFGDGKTSLRGGVGVFYGTRTEGTYQANGNAVSNYTSVLTNPALYTAKTGVTNAGGRFTNPYANTKLGNPFPRNPQLSKTEAFPSAVTVYTFDGNGHFPPPVIYQWNLTLEQQLTSNLFTRLSYVGTDSGHMTTYSELNPTILGARFRPEYGSILDTNAGGNSHYHSLQFSMQQRVSHGLTLLANYTWSKSLDSVNYQYQNSLGYTLPVNWSPDLITAFQSNGYQLNNGDFRALDRGLSDFDRRHVVSASYVWKLPRLGPNTHRALRAVANGWETTGIVQVQSADTLTLYTTGDASQTALGQDRAVYDGVSNPYARGNCGTPGFPCLQWFNTAAFSSPVGPGTKSAPNTNTQVFGNVKKGSFAGPGYVNWDAGIFRTIPIHESMNLQFRAEYFNVLNHNNPGDPNVDLAGGNFGNITTQNASTGVYQPRVAQLALKLKF